MTGSAARIAVGVFPAGELERRKALFAALEQAFPVRFEGRRPGEWRDLDAVLELGDGAGTAASSGLPALSLLRPEPAAAGAPAAQSLADLPGLDRRLRGAVLPDDRLGSSLDAGTGLGSTDGATVLASCAGVPTWVRSGKAERALLAPAELETGEALRERLCLERSAALLPLAHFLKQLSAPMGWQPPAPRASIVFDDPNLHWPSYGFIKLDELGRHALVNGYHAALAMPPLDSRFAHPGAVRALEESRGALSLLVHGNDHHGGELGRLAGEAEAIALAAQALRRVGAFEGRTGIAVERVMVPPHEQCSEDAVPALLRCGFEAITMTRPFPWLAVAPSSWLARPQGADALVGWNPADFAAGLPVLLRHPLVERDAPELVLRAFLDQPLILYGHHGDVAAGLDVLASAAADVNRLGERRWCSLSEIAAGNFETRGDGATLGIRPFSRKVRVEVPAEAEQLVVELPSALPTSTIEKITVGARPAQAGEPVGVTPGTVVEVRLHPANAVDPRSVSPPKGRPLALARRVLGESRDRLLPLTGRRR